MSRWLRFFFIMLVGVGLGLLYGWVIDPVDYVDTAPTTLRADYKADYVLMVAEIYNADRDAEAAVMRLTYLGDPSPVDSVQNALVSAVEAGYSPDDLRLLRDLADALAPLTPPVEGALP
ncbi:MAG TPA: hypothetical protein EYP88_02935 [Anaerolineales bacterium]|nr:hypothetical protein [Anaerolineales bacterium]